MTHITTETRYVIERDGKFYDRDSVGDLCWTPNLANAIFGADGDAMRRVASYPVFNGACVRRVTVTTTYVIEGE